MADYSTQYLNDLIKQIGLGMNISKTYPKGHPSLIPVVQRLRILLKEIPIEEESISLVVVEDIIMIGNQRFDSKRLPIIKNLVQRFNQLGVKSVTFNVELSEDDIKEYFSAMAATPAEISDYGDIVALMRVKGVKGIIVNKFRVGVISSDRESQSMDWEQFLESLSVAQPTMTDEERVKELSNFLTSIGIAGTEAPTVQTGKIVAGLEKLALMVADQYGEDRWAEYSMVFSRMLSALSPTIKKNVVKYRTENKKLGVLFKNLIPTMSDEDIIDIVSTKAKEKSPEAEQEIVDILRSVTGAKLPGILSTLRVNVPELDFEKVVGRLMSELKTTKGKKAADKFMSKNLEAEMRTIFPHLRSQSHEERIKAIDDLMKFSDKIFEAEDYDLMRLLVDRLDTMADAETDMKTFNKAIESLKTIYLRTKKQKKDEMIQFVSKKFGKHLLRKDVALIEKKKKIIKIISEVKDQNYVAELVSLLWDPGTFTEAREALTSLSEFSVPLLVETLKETDDRSVRMKIIDILVRIGEAATGEVKKLLSASEWYIRRNGVFILGEMKLEEALHEVGGLINDGSEQVQLAVVEYLNKIGGKKTKDYIRKGLNSKHKSVILAAMKSLEKSDVEQKINEVVQWLKSRKGIPSAKEEQFRCEIINALANFGDDSVIDSLVAILDEKALFKGAVLHPTKEAALNALAKIGSDKAMQVLRNAANHKDDFVAVSAESILARSNAKDE